MTEWSCRVAGAGVHDRRVGTRWSPGQVRAGSPTVVPHVRTRLVTAVANRAAGAREIAPSFAKSPMGELDLWAFDIRLVSFVGVPEVALRD